MGTIFNNSVFAEYFPQDDPELVAWSSNVLEKLRKKGIVPAYIDRTFDESDSDYDSLYEPITLFFGYLVRLAREFEAFKTNQQLTNNYLVSMGHYTCGDEGLDQLLYTITNLLRRRAKRGTIDNITPGTPATTEADGEILSLVCWDDLTFFKLGVARPHKNSWNVNNSSPLHRGCTGRYDLNIGYENTEDVVDLSVYPLLNSAHIKKTEYRNRNCIEIEGVLGGDAGIGAADLSKKIIVNAYYNYEITFYIAQDITLENVTFGFKCYDIFNNELSPKSAVHGGPKSFFFQTRRLNQAGKFYFVRGIIFNRNQPNMSVEDAKLNIGFGEALRFPDDACSIIPYIVMDDNLANDSDSGVDNFADSDSIDIFDSADSDSISAASDYFDGAASIYLWNIKVTPCSTDYERCYLNNKNFIDIIIANKNGQYNKDQIKDILRKYFIPYNTAFNLVNLPRTLEDSSNLDNLLLEDGDDILFEDGGLILLE